MPPNLFSIQVTATVSLQTQSSFLLTKVALINEFATVVTWIPRSVLAEGPGSRIGRRNANAEGEQARRFQNDNFRRMLIHSVLGLDRQTKIMLPMCQIHSFVFQERTMGIHLIVSPFLFVRKVVVRSQSVFVLSIQFPQVFKSGKDYLDNCWYFPQVFCTLTSITNLSRILS